MGYSGKGQALLVCLVVVYMLAFASANGTSERQGRLLSNPLGLLGHASCSAAGEGESLAQAGKCYNELECIGRGGAIKGYCSPRALGACCVFTASRCNRKVTQAVTYFTNPSFPATDSSPLACLLRIAPPTSVCYVQLDYEVLDVPSVNGKCAYDSISLLRSAEGPAGRVCGHKAGYATLTRVDPGKELGVSALMQSGQYRWSIKISMVPCSEVGELVREPQCGLAGGEVRHRSLVRRKIKLRGGRRVKRESREVCEAAGYQEVCALARAARMGAPVLPSVSDLDRKKYSGELFRPSFSARSAFCDSKFGKLTNYPPAQAKLYDGFEAPEASFPWMASLQYKGKHFCGGSLVSPQWVLTVAHCPDFPNVEDFLSHLSVLLGATDLFDRSEPGRVDRAVTKVLNYPLYDQAGYNGDLALLRLDSPVQISRYIRPVCLPADSIDTYEQQVGVAAGWGQIETGALPDRLRYVELNIVPNISCVANLGLVDIQITEKMVCTFRGPTGRETTCTGDSGGPLMVRRSGRFVLVGATSFSLVDCESPFPNVFSRVSAFLQWIAVAMQDFGTVE